MKRRINGGGHGIYAFIPYGKEGFRQIQMCPKFFTKAVVAVELVGV